MAMSDEQFEFLKDIAKFINFVEELNTVNKLKGIDKVYKITAGEMYRPIYMQKKYVKDGKSKTMKSNHLKRLAFDVNYFINGELTYDKKELQIFGDFWESLNKKNKWGGNFKNFLDTPHFERRV